MAEPAATVFLTFKNVDGLSFDSAYGQLKYEIGDYMKNMHIF